MILHFVTNVTNFILFYLFLQVLIIYLYYHYHRIVYMLLFFFLLCEIYIYIYYIYSICIYSCMCVFQFVYVYINMYAWIFTLQSYMLTDNLGQLMWLNVVCVLGFQLFLLYLIFSQNSTINAVYV